MIPGRQRFSRRLRLSGGVDFRRVFRCPCKVGDAAVVVLARPNGLSYPRLGLAIGRKVVHAAVTRNRLKRLIRESFRRHQRTLGHLDIVVWVRKDLVDPVATAFGHTLDGYWQQLVDRCGGV